MQKQVTYGAALLGAGAYAYLAYFHQRDLFVPLIGVVFLLFAITYLWLHRAEVSDKTGFMVGLIFRLVWLLALPALSDDFIRFLWDGHLLLNGVNPFAFTPTQALETVELATHVKELYPYLNSPDYYSVYPPVSQLVYMFGALFEDPFYGVIAIRVVLIAGDVLAYVMLSRLLKALGKPSRWALWYFLNPLLIIEVTGNLHFEGLMIAFLASCLLFLHRQKSGVSAGFFALSVATKLLPLMFLPFLLLRTKGKERWMFLGVISVVIALLFFPFLSVDMIAKPGESVALYFQSFEFNAGFYYLLRQIGYWFSGYNMIGVIGAALGLISLMTILALSVWGRKREMESIMLWISLTYLFFATTVHPWYVIVPLFFSVMTSFSFVWVWSAMVFLSYAAYQTAEYTENYLLIAIEYAIVMAFAVYEFRKSKAVLPD